jgi:hypothetical protein
MSGRSPAPTSRSPNTRRSRQSGSRRGSSGSRMSYRWSAIPRTTCLGLAAWPMTMGPEPRMRMLCGSVRLGIDRCCLRARARAPARTRKFRGQPARSADSGCRSGAGIHTAGGLWESLQPDAETVSQRRPIRAPKTHSGKIGSHLSEGAQHSSAQRDEGGTSTSGRNGLNRAMIN